MALIDPKHLAAPFKNTVHIVTIVAFVLLFVVFRIATGGVEFQDSTQAMKAVTQPGSVVPAVKKPLNTEEQNSLSSPPLNKTVIPEDADLSEIEKALGLTN
jgi:hypothetical protein